MVAVTITMAVMLINSLIFKGAFGCPKKYNVDKNIQREWVRLHLKSALWLYCTNFIINALRDRNLISFFVSENRAEYIPPYPEAKVR